MAVDPNARLVVVFKDHPIKNEAKSKAEGRPIFDNMEVCEIRIAGDQNTVGVYPAHDVTRFEGAPDGGQEPVTYAMAYARQYQRFKDKKAQVQEGTPLEELTFISAAKRSELKALNIHTAESLAALDGKNLKSLGVGGRELKNQAQAYIDQAKDSATVSRLASDNEALREQLRMLTEERDALRNGVGVTASPADDDGEGPCDGNEGSEGSQFAEWADDQLKAFIKERTGSAPRGTPTHATLVAMAEDIAAREDA